MSVPLPAESQSLVARLGSALRRMGWKGLIAQYYRRYSSLLVRRTSDIVMSKDLAESDDASRGTLLQVRPFEGDDPTVLDRIAASGHADSDDMELMRIYVRRGYRALFAEVDGRMVGHMWWVDAEFTGERAHPHLSRYGIPLGPREAYAFTFFLEPGCRGAGYANEYLSKVEQHLRSRGFERVWGYVSSENRPARWLYSLCGWRPQKVINSWVIAGRLLFAKDGVFVRNSPRGKVPWHDYRRVV